MHLAFWIRLTELAEEPISPERILSLEDEALRQIGISYSKIKYLKALATAALYLWRAIDDKII